MPQRDHDFMNRSGLLKPKHCPHQHLLEPFCNRPLLEGGQACFWHSGDRKKYDLAVMRGYFGDSRSLGEAIQTEIRSGASLCGAYLAGADLGGSFGGPRIDLSGGDLRNATLTEARLNFVSLRGARLQGANLEFASLSDADIVGALFHHANLHGVRLNGNDLSEVVGLTKESFRGWSRHWIPVYRPSEEGTCDAETTYRGLIQYFSRQGRHADASWAAYRCGVARHRVLTRALNPRIVSRELRLEQFFTSRQENKGHTRVFTLVKWVVQVLEWVLSWLSRWTFGYGEKPGRAALTSALVILMYAFLYSWLGVIDECGFPAALYFSITTFTTLGYGDLTPRAGLRWVAATEPLAGILLTGLFLFTLGRRSAGRF